MNEWTIDMSLGQGNDPHTNATGSYFTCQPLSPNSNDPLMPVSEHFEPAPIGPSLDHVMAQQLTHDGMPLVMQVGNVFSSHAAVSFIEAETPYPGMGSIRQLFTALTGLFDGGETPDSYQAVRGQSVLDLVQEDLATLKRFDMSASDRQKLATWEELLHRASRVCGQDVATSLGLSEELVSTTSAGGFGSDISAPLEASTLDLADLYSDLAVLAAACNVNPVMLLVYPAGHVYQHLGLTSDSDILAHRVGSPQFGGVCEADVLDKLAVIDDFYARKFAYLVGRLNDFEEGDETMLDHTAAVWFQEVSDGLARNLNNLPIIQAGSCGGYFKTGWAINVEDGAEDLTRGNSEAVCAEGSSGEFTSEQALAKITGTDRSLANAPINKYFCNLMNALGVRAGEDGFPLAGGSADVTHFGRYDKTEDFIGGDVNPPTIHDPGEFDGLRA